MTVNLLAVTTRWQPRNLLAQRAYIKRPFLLRNSTVLASTVSLELKLLSLVISASTVPAELRLPSFGNLSFPVLVYARQRASQDPLGCCEGRRPDRGVEEAANAPEKLSASPPNSASRHGIVADYPLLDVAKAIRLSREGIEWKSRRHLSAANLTLGKQQKTIQYNLRFKGYHTDTVTFWSSNVWDQQGYTLEVSRGKGSTQARCPITGVATMHQRVLARSGRLVNVAFMNDYRALTHAI